MSTQASTTPAPIGSVQLVIAGKNLTRDTFSFSSVSVPKPRTTTLEAVSAYDTETFIAALKRFVARRGLCVLMISDQGIQRVRIIAARWLNP